MTQQITDVPVVRIDNPGELLASIPQLLGFRPEESVVLLGGAARRARGIGPVLRCDLPPPRKVRELAGLMVARIKQAGSPSAIIVVIGGGDPEGAKGALPHAPLVRAIRRELKRRRIEHRDALWTNEIRADAPWRCYDHQSCRGTLPDPTGTVLAATAASIGLVTMASRDELARQFEPDDEDAMRRRSGLIDAHLRELDGDAEGWTTERGVTAVRTALCAARAGNLTLSDARVAELALALCDVRVRDACLATATPPTSPRAQAAFELWRALTCALPIPERAEAACLAGYAAYVRGDGPTAGMALDTALDANPAHLLSALLKRALEHGMDPRGLQRLGQSSGIALWPPDDGRGPATEGSGSG